MGLFIRLLLVYVVCAGYKCSDLDCDFQEGFCGWDHHQIFLTGAHSRSVGSFVLDMLDPQHNARLCGVDGKHGNCVKYSDLYPGNSWRRVKVKGMARTIREVLGFCDEDSVYLFSSPIFHAPLNWTSSYFVSKKLLTSFQTRCLHYRFLLTGSASLVVMFLKNENDIYSGVPLRVHGTSNKVYSFTNASVDLPEGQYKIVFRSVFKEIEWNFVFIDAIAVSDGKCAYSCLPDQFKCGSEECVSSLFVCNQVYDCADGSDEEFCYNLTERYVAPALRSLHYTNLSNTMLMYPAFKNPPERDPDVKNISDRDSDVKGIQDRDSDINSIPDRDPDAKNVPDRDPDAKNVPDRGLDAKYAPDKNSSFSSDILCINRTSKLPSCLTVDSSRNTSQGCPESSSENSVVCSFFCPSMCNCSEASVLCFRKTHPGFSPKITLRGVDCNSFHIDQFGDMHILELAIIDSLILNLIIVPSTSLTLNKLTLKNSVFGEISIQPTKTNSYINLILINNCTMKNIIANILDFGFSYQHDSEIPVVFDLVKISVFRKTIELSGRLREHIEHFVFFNNTVTNLSHCDIHKFSERLNIHEHSSSIRTLDLSYNALRVYKHADATETLYLNNNLLKETPISYDIKRENPLKVLDMSCNEISALRRGRFLPPGLLYLNVSRNTIEYIDGNVFHEKSTLIVLDLSWNRISHIQSGTFASLKRLQELYIHENQIHITDGMFAGLFSLRILQVDSFSFCCAKPETVKDALCIAPVCTISSCDSLIAVPVLRVIIWYMALLAFFGNGAVLLNHILGYKRNCSKSYIILTMNLSCADLLMSIYLFIIGIANIIHSGKYGVNDYVWRHSVPCTAAGIIATLSSEVSAIIVFLITFDRFIAIRYPFSRLRLKASSASFAAFFAWALSLVLTLLPLSSASFFEDFYAQSGICISLPLSVIRKPGWEYSMILFVGLNFILFLGIFVGQLFIFREVTKTRKMISAPRTKTLETVLAVNLFAVVMTDILCWIPIGTIGMLTFLGLDVSHEIYDWITVLVLPINSALNPIIYTLTAVIRHKKGQCSEETAQLKYQLSLLKARLIELNPTEGSILMRKPTPSKE